MPKKINSMMRSLQCIVVGLVVLSSTFIEASSRQPIAPRLQCLRRFSRFNFEVRDFGKYQTYFRDDSELTLAQSGVYHGAEGIEEYVKFGYSLYFATGPEPDRVVNYLSYNRETGECKFLVRYMIYRSMNPNYTAATDATMNIIVMFEIAFNYNERYIPTIHLFFSEEYLRLLFGDYLISDQTREYVCGVMTGVCSPNITTPANCTDELKALLTIGEPGGYFDGNSQGCRALHAVLAESNQNHCPHISFTPMVDIFGRIKCQQSSLTLVSDLFSKRELKMYRSFCKKKGIDPNMGYRILPPGT